MHILPCPSCGESLRIPDHFLNLVGNCKKCGQKFTPRELASSQNDANVAPRQSVAATVNAGAPPSLREEQPQSAASLSPKSHGPVLDGGAKFGQIGGWLILPAIGLVFAPVRTAASFVIGTNSIQIFAPELAGDFRLTVVALIDLTMILACIAVAVLFFQKRKLAKSAVIGLLLATLLMNLLQAILISSLFGEIDLVIVKPVIGACISAAVWVPYFIYSKRVEQTFVR